MLLITSPFYRSSSSWVGGLLCCAGPWDGFKLRRRLRLDANSFKQHSLQAVTIWSRVAGAGPVQTEAHSHWQEKSFFVFCFVEKVVLKAFFLGEISFTVQWISVSGVILLLPWKRDISVFINHGTDARLVEFVKDNNLFTLLFDAPPAFQRLRVKKGFLSSSLEARPSSGLK